MNSVQLSMRGGALRLRSAISTEAMQQEAGEFFFLSFFFFFFLSLLDYSVCYAIVGGLLQFSLESISTLFCLG